jgi:hypothetical protein
MARYDGERPFTIGQHIEIPVHYDMWMRGARFGRVVSYHDGGPGRSAFIKIKMDHPQVKRLFRVWRIDWDYVNSR